MAKRLVPLLDRVLVQKLAAPDKTVGGILLPETVAKVRMGADLGMTTWCSKVTIILPLSP